MADGQAMIEIRWQLERIADRGVSTLAYWSLDDLEAGQLRERLEAIRTLVALRDRGRELLAKYEAGELSVPDTLGALRVLCDEMLSVPEGGA